jgi:hypothetical protein
MNGKEGVSKADILRYRTGTENRNKMISMNNKCMKET